MRLKIEDVSKSFQQFKLVDINLEINDGEYFVILGPTGAGKTVLLKTIMGFHKPDGGRLILDGCDITDTPAEKRGIGYMPQNCVLFPHMTVRQNIEFGLKMRATDKDERTKATDRILDLLGIKSLENRLPLTLSGGETQKVSLARVLVLEPHLILLDEPLSVIDAEARRHLRDELKKIHRTLHVTIIHVTHDQMEALSLAERLAIMKDGAIVQVDKAEKVFNNPRNEFVAKFLGYENIYRAKAGEHNKGLSRLYLDGITVNMSGRVKDTTALVAIRPDEIIVSKKPLHSSSRTWNVFEGTITDCMDLGPFVNITADIGVVIKATVTKHSFLDLKIDVGQRVWISFKASSVRTLE